ncbi:phenylalanine--tRNA ligase subunit alpha [bacterium]|nr:phenylalanine--tRNA ligase subunit alpha [bacterium]
MINQAIQQLRVLAEEAASAIAAAGTTAALDDVQIRYLGRKGAVAEQMKLMKGLTADERPRLGQAANETKLAIEAAIDARRTALLADEDARKLDQDRVDVTLPGRPRWLGAKHPVTQALEDITDIFRQLGFAIEEGPEIEDEWHCFDALNVPADHPARDAQDTFFISSTPDVDASNNRMILRTHTSPVQIRGMKNRTPPVRFIAPGRVYRNDKIDASHYPIFTQIEGLYVDKNVSFADLKGTLLAFARLYYGPNVNLRFRPSYFPFTEPSAEVDVSCSVCGGSGCRVCKQTGWVEVLGSGMVHPNVFRAVGYNPDEVTGFAFGMGIERIAMLKHGIDDIRLFYENDIRFLEQFA